MNLPFGKHLFLWQKENCGSIQAIVDMVKRLDLESLLVKVANGNHLWPGLEELFYALRAIGKRVGAWHYVYGGVYYDKSAKLWKTSGITPAQEAQVSLSAIARYKPDYFVIDAEAEYKKNLVGIISKEARAEQYMNALRSGGVEIPVGLSTYRYPRVHADFPFKEFLAQCDYVAPQVYWNPPSALNPSFGPVAELRRSISEYSTLLSAIEKSHLPIIPTGRAYIGDGYGNPGPSYEEITAFLKEAKDSKLEGASFWALDYLFLPTHAENQAERIQAIEDFEWERPAPFEPTWATVDTTANYVYLRPQAMSGADQPYSGIVYDGKPVLKFGEVVNEKGERWALVGGYVLNSLLKEQ